MIDDNFLRLYFEQMVEAVGTIHEQKIVHSDLKPANFLFVEGALKLIDFGIAKQDTSKSDTTNIVRDHQVGTVNYMSPEAILNGQPSALGGPLKVGRASDIWSLGCILYQMVYGQTPFARITGMIPKLHAITDPKHTIPMPPVANPHLTSLISACLERHPHRRITIAEILSHQFLRPAAAAQTVQAAAAKFRQQLRRYVYVTPTSYLELIKLYLDMLGRQRETVSGNEQRYRGGLQKLAETEDMVAELQETLTKMGPDLKKAAKETEELLVKVDKDQKAADKQQAIVEKDVEEANKVAKSVGIMAEDCQRDLDAALPAYYDAIKALDSLDKKSIQELKSFPKPPPMVAYTLEAVCILFGVKPNWDESKKLMGDSMFMKNLETYDKDNISPKVIKQLKKFVDNPDFMPSEVKKVSSAAMCLCMWARAMYMYDTVAKTIAPKKASLVTAQGELKEVQDKLAVKQEQLRAVLAKVAELKATLAAAVARKEELSAQEERCKVQLVRADQLLGGLGGEKVRWAASAEQLGKDMINLVGNMLLASGFIAYLGPFISEFRKDMASAWVQLCKGKKIPVDEDFSLERTLANPVVVREWQIMGLPADEFSTENGMLTTLGRRWPLMIDPQGQANRWIRNMFAQANLQIIKLTEKDFLRTLENAIRYGAPVLLENVEEELDPSLEPVLLKQVFKKGGQYLIRLGSSDVPYNDEFRFFITTKLANPHYLPEVCIKVTIINFTVTMSGLEDQLLVDVIKNERADLEEKKDQLVISIAADQKALKELEDRILYMLANASGNILDDEELIHALGQSKVTSKAINSRLVEAEATTREINETREGYRVVATRGSIIYFVIASLALVDPMYQFSLEAYKALFTQRLQRAEPNEIVTMRLEILIEDVTRSMYVMVCRGLFEKDKMLYAFMMCANILRHAGVISAAEWKTFMVGPGTADPKANPAPSSVKWMNANLWSDLVMMESTIKEVYGGLPKHVASQHVHQRGLPDRKSVV